MRILLFIGFLVFAGMGLLVRVTSKTSIGEIQGGICFLIAAILFSGAAVVDSVLNTARLAREDRARLNAELIKQLQKPAQ